MPTDDALVKPVYRVLKNQTPNSIELLETTFSLFLPLLQDFNIIWCILSSPTKGNCCGGGSRTPKVSGGKETYLQLELLTSSNPSDQYF